MGTSSRFAKVKVKGVGFIPTSGSWSDIQSMKPYGPGNTLQVSFELDSFLWAFSIATTHFVQRVGRYSNALLHFGVSIPKKQYLPNDGEK